MRVEDHQLAEDGRAGERRGALRTALAAASRGACAGTGRARGRTALGQRGDIGGGILVRRALPLRRGATFRRLVIRPPRRRVVRARSNACAPVRVRLSPQSALRASRSSRSIRAARISAVAARIQAYSRRGVRRPNADASWLVSVRPRVPSHVGGRMRVPRGGEPRSRNGRVRMVERRWERGSSSTRMREMQRAQGGR
jgi:hypothetical protein